MADTLGLIVGNREGFPGYVCESGRKTMLDVLQREGFAVVTLGPEDTSYGSVGTLEDAIKCGELFKRHSEAIQGIVVTLPNFGDERAIANSIRFSGLDVPVLVHAYPDDMRHMGISERRDSFCGKISVCNNLSQYGIPFTLPGLHTVNPETDDFLYDLRRFRATCRVVRGVRGARIGALGARPTAFNTVRYSEKILESENISVETLDLSEIIGRAHNLRDDEPALQNKLAELAGYVDVSQVPASSLDRMARFSLVVDRWVADQRLDATAIQCWTAIEEYFGIMPCTVMSLMSNKLLPSACETDVNGALSMLILQLASGQPSMLLDWNNNFEDDPDKTIVFHCSNLPAHAFCDGPRIDSHPVHAETLGEENAYGRLQGRIKDEPFTYLRVSTDDLTGSMSTYVGEAEFTSDSLDTYGGFGVALIPGFQDLLYFICKNRFEHHVAANLALVADAVEDALSNYLDWDVYYHS